MDLSRLLRTLKDRPLAVVGDGMLDRFVHGQVDRISPEAPVPVVHVRKEEERLGGAANVAANAAALGATVSLFGIVGDDDGASRLEGLVSGLGIDTSALLRDGERVTGEKIRILAGNQQVVRIDRESTMPLSERSRGRLLAEMEERGPFAAVIVSDYGKGVVGPPLMELMRRWHDDGSVVVVDPKQGNFDLYRGITAITPNEREAAVATHDHIHDDDDAQRVGQALMDRLANDMLLLTRGENGMTLLAEGLVRHLPTEAREVYDVTGAGDTVIATFTAMLLAGASPPQAAALSNVAAGLVVKELGTAVISSHALAESWARRQGDSSGAGN